MDDKHAESPAEVVLAVPEIRDYHAINAEIVRQLDAGRRTIWLAGVRGHRLLAAGLAGGWTATIEVDGGAGPELAAGLDAPGLTVIARGDAADGAASRLRAGTVLVLGDVGIAFGYAMAGGVAIAARNAAGRAGLRQGGGDLVLLGDAGPLAGELQSGGRLFADRDRIGPHAGRGRRGGRLIGLARHVSIDRAWTVAESDHVDLIGRLESVRPWLGPIVAGLFVGPLMESPADGRAKS